MLDDGVAPIRVGPPRGLNAIVPDSGLEKPIPRTPLSYRVRLQGVAPENSMLTDIVRPSRGGTASKSDGISFACSHT